MEADLYDLERFVKAQNNYDSYNIALQEIKDGRKLSHWMWYVFPQIQGLGHSSTSQKYSIKSLSEAKAYLEHDTLGKRLYEAMRALPVNGNAIEIFGRVDAMKLRSCLTLFNLVSSDDIFADLLDNYFNKERCRRTLKIVSSELSYFKKDGALFIEEPLCRSKEETEERKYNGVVRPEYTPNAISSLKADEVFVFGSNLHGHHGGGAARVAWKNFGAIRGQGVGLQGQSYAIPTMHGGIETIKPYVDQFIAFAKEHTELFFYVTRIGCGIAGFKDSDMAPLFKNAITIDNICLPKSFVDIQEEHVINNVFHTPKSYKIMMYGQCRTFADIVKTLNEQHHYKSFEELQSDFGGVIEQYQHRGIVNHDSLDVMEKVFIINRKKLFEDNRFHFGRFIEALESAFNDEAKSEIDIIFANRQRTKLMILLKTLNDICHYRDVEELRYDLFSIATGRFNCGDNSYMSDPLSCTGNYPINLFLRGLQEQWNNVTVNGTLDNALLEQVMFAEHSNKVARLGLDEVISNDFTAVGSCHPNVFNPKSTGTTLFYAFYPKSRGSAPVYVRDELSRRYIKACGKGIGPQSGHELYEMRIVKPILWREVKNGNYERLGGMYYIPVGTIRKPIFIEGYGRVHFASLSDKRKFISDVRNSTKGC